MADKINKTRIAVLLRVYDRIEDLKHNLQIIADTWKENNYYVIVISNGASNGYEVPSSFSSRIDKLVTLEENAGHRKGNSQLLLEGLKYIPHDCEFTLILEADTWVYGDAIQSKYTKLLSESENVVWASSDWYDKLYALATDFALIKTDYLINNPGLFDFELFPECHMSNYLRDNGGDFMWITENMPEHVPSYVKIAYPYIPNIKEGRFYVFPKSKIVTHHIEYIKGGMLQKMRYFNIIADTDYFADTTVGCKKWHRFKMRFWIGFSKFFVKKSWFRKKRYLDIPEI